MENAFEWVEPKEWHAAKVKRELQGVLGFFSTFRIVLLSSIIIWLFATWMERTCGPVGLDWFFYGTVAVSAGFASLWAGCAILHTTRNYPPTIRVDRSGVTISVGPEKHMFPFGNIQCIEVTAHEGQVPLFVFERGSHRFEYAIAPEVNLDALRRGIEEFRRSGI